MSGVLQQITHGSTGIRTSHSPIFQTRFSAGFGKSGRSKLGSVPLKAKMQPYFSAVGKAKSRAAGGTGSPDAVATHLPSGP